MIVKVSVNKIIIPQGLLPRVFGTKEEVIEQYKEAMEMGSEFPPVKLWQKSKDEYWLIDGAHRLIAWKRLGKEFIEAEIVEIENEVEFIRKAIEENAKHGLPLTSEDRRESARRLYIKGYDVKSISKIFSVSEWTVHKWLSGLKAEVKQNLKQKAIEMRKQGYTQEKIADNLNIPRQTISNWLRKEELEELKDEINTREIEEEIDWDATGWNEEEKEKEEYDGSWDDWNDYQQEEEKQETSQKKQEKQEKEYKTKPSWVVLEEASREMELQMARIYNSFGWEKLKQVVEELLGKFEEIEEIKRKRGDK